MVTYPRSPVFITVLGAVFVALYSIITYLIFTNSLGGVLHPVSVGVFFYPIVISHLFLMIGGPVFLIVGICELGKQHFKSHWKHFNVLTVILVLFFFALENMVFYVIGSLQVGL